MSRPSDVHRTRLLSVMCQDQTPLVALIAPAGFGKTTTAVQWSEECNRAIAWATLDETDNDPVVLMSTIVAAISRASDEHQPWRGQITGDEPSFSRDVRPRFRAYIEALTVPTTFVIDDVQVLTDPRSRGLLELLCEVVPQGSQVALVGRSMIGLRTSLEQGRGRLAHIYSDELAFDQNEARSAFALWSGGRHIAADWLAVYTATEGWPVAVYLASKLPTMDLARWLPNDVAVYLDREVLADADGDVREMLVATSILDTLCGSLCDTVTGKDSSYHLLRRAAAESSLVNRLDGPGEWYRLHPLLRQRLLAELRHTEPGRLPALHQGASEWFRRHGFPDSAIAHAISSGNVALMGVEIWDEAVRTIVFGRVARLTQWLDRIPADLVRQSAALSMCKAWAGISSANSALALDWVNHAAQLMATDADSSAHPTTLRPLMSLMHAVIGRAGYQESAAMAEEAYRMLPVGHPIRPLALLQSGVSRTFSGDHQAGRIALTDARTTAQAEGIANTWAQAAVLCGFVAAEDGEAVAADALFEQARRVWHSHELSDSAITEALVAAASGWQLAKVGREQ